MTCRLLFSTIFSSPVFKLIYFLDSSFPFCSGFASVYLLSQGSIYPVHYVSSLTKSKDFDFINQSPLISENVKTMHFVFIKLPILLCSRGCLENGLRLYCSLLTFSIQQRKVREGSEQQSAVNLHDIYTSLTGGLGNSQTFKICLWTNALFLSFTLYVSRKKNRLDRCLIWLCLS